MSSSDLSETFENLLIDNRFVVGQSIGKGSFGEVFDGYDNFTGARVAIKFESHDSTHKQLENEYKIYRFICGGAGIPNVHCFGTTQNYDYLVMELLGPSLEKLFNFCRRKFTLKTVLMLGHQMIDRIEYVHQMSHLHRDLKPDNFVVNSQNGLDIYLIDFGLARRYCQFINNKVEHVPCVRLQSFTGTARYASIGAQQQFTTSRKDDLESLGYILVYFLKGRLPWQHVPRAGPNGITPKQRKERILEIKLSTHTAELCAGLPKEIESFINYCRALKFEEQPNYAQLRSFLRTPFQRNMFIDDGRFDWTDIDENKKKTKRNNSIKTTKI